MTGARALLVLSLLSGSPVAGQLLIVDRGAPGPAVDSVRLGSKKSAGFVGDHFTAGAAGEVWIIDAIRTWAVPGKTPPPSARLSDVYEKVELFGGIESSPPPPGGPPEPACDCHNLMVIKTRLLQPGADEPSLSSVRFSGAAPPAWQLDFRDLHWSIPGGVPIQFGVMGVARRVAESAEPFRWYSLGGKTGSGHELKAFDEKGKADGLYDGHEPDLDKTYGIYIQVWGHRTASIAIRSLRPAIEVVLDGSLSFDVKQTDLESLRFGAKGAPPIASRFEDAGGQMRLLLRFRAADLAVQPVNVAACLTGRQRDGTPFEGCALLRQPK